MRSRVTTTFRKKFAQLPRDVQTQARQAYRLWKNDPYHQSLQFEQKHTSNSVYSARIGQHWRVLGLKDGNTVDWFWIGSHAEYDNLLGRL